MKDHYIRALEFAELRGEFAFEDLVEELDLTDLQKKQFALQIHYKQIFFQDHVHFYGHYEKERISLYFSVEDKFRLLNYLALQESRESSKSASKYSIAALLVSTVSFIVSAVFSYAELVK